MQYKDLKEMNIKDWDGKPFKAYYTDDPGCNIDGQTTEILGYIRGLWLSSVRWMHVYPVCWNKEKVEEALNLKSNRMTNRQIAMWLATGNGELSGVNYVTIFSTWSYPKDEQDNEVSEGIIVRKWGSKEWIEPTVDLLEGM